MPNLSRINKELDSLKKVRGQLKTGNPVELEGVLLVPSMRDGDAESDLSSIERMIDRLEERKKGAVQHNIAMGRKVSSDDFDGVAPMGRGAAAMARDMKLDESDLAKIIPTGSGGLISKRDVRVYAIAKGADRLEEYANASDRRRTAKPADKPAEKPADKPVDKPAAKSVAKPAVKPVAKSAAKKVNPIA